MESREERIVRILKWEKQYAKWQKGQAITSLLFETGLDGDFAKAFRLLNLPHTNVLDIGCGTGKLSVQAAGLGHKVTGLDISKIAIQHAATLHPENCRFFTGDFLHYIFDDTFEIVMDRGFTTVLPKELQDQYVSSLNKILKSKGYYLLKFDARKQAKISILTGISKRVLIK